MIEKVIFYILSFSLFIIMFGKLLKRKDKIYLYIGIAELIGLFVRFFDVTNKIKLSDVSVITIYVICILIPLIVVCIEYENIFLSEILTILSARISLKNGKNRIARKKLVRLVTKHPNSYYAHKFLAQIYEKEGKYEDAIDEYVKAVDVNSKDYDSYYQIALLLNKNEKQDEAEKMLVNLLNKKPEYYKASELLGSILYDKEQFTKAVAVLQKALKYNPSMYELYYNLGMVYTRLNDFQTAKEYYEKAATINSLCYHAKLNIAQIALIMADLNEAEEKFAECLRNKDSEGYAYYYLSIIALLKGKEDVAVQYINMAIELDSNIYNLAYKHDIFSPIRAQIRSSETKKTINLFSHNELKTIEHLDNTFMLIGKMKENNLKLQNQDKREQRINEKEHKYREEY